MFRHSIVTYLLKEGCDILIVKELLGHESLESIQIHTHVSNERLRQVYLSYHPRSIKNKKSVNQKYFYLQYALQNEIKKFNKYNFLGIMIMDRKEGII